MTHVFYVSIVSALLLSGCNSSETAPASATLQMEYSDFYSNFVVKDINHYGCTVVTKSELNHILDTGEYIDSKTLHDRYSSVGCSVDGRVSINGDAVTFEFDYGGVFHLSNGRFLACGEHCCRDGFEYCTYE